MAKVSLRQVEKRYPGDVLAVEAFDLEIADGEFVVLVGPSGCGKSTTLRMVAGLEDITDGTIHIGDREVNDVHPKDRDVAMVFRSYALYPHMTVFENMAFGLRLRKMPNEEIKKLVGHAASMLELENLLERKPKALSGGQRQRVAMGRAIVRQPAVFLFDEPLSNLDARLRVQMRLEIAKLHRELGATMIYVTHDQTEAMTLADRLVVMSEGRLQQVGTPTELYQHPRNRFVAGFIGNPGMNFISGDWTSEGGEHAFVAEGIRVPFDAAPDGAGAAASLGIRPEDLRVTEAGGHGSGTVEHIEYLGAHIFAHLKAGDSTVTVRLPADAKPSVGEAIHFELNVASSQLFDAYGNNVIEHPTT